MSDNSWAATLIAAFEADRGSMFVHLNNGRANQRVSPAHVDELVRLARLGLEAERSTIDLTGEAMRDCIEYLHKNDGFRSLRVRVFDGEVKLEILTAAKGLDPIAEARGSLFHDAVATLKDDW